MSSLSSDPVGSLTIGLGWGQIHLLLPSAGARLRGSVQRIRRNLAERVGVVLLPVRFSDLPGLPNEGWVVWINGVQIDRGQLSVPRPNPPIAPFGTLEQLRLELLSSPSLQDQPKCPDLDEWEEKLTGVLHKKATQLLNPKLTDAYLEECRKRDPNLVDQFNRARTLFPKDTVLSDRFYRLCRYLLERGHSIRHPLGILAAAQGGTPRRKNADWESWAHIVERRMQRVCPGPDLLMSLASSSIHSRYTQYSQDWPGHDRFSPSVQLMVEILEHGSQLDKVHYQPLRGFENYSMVEVRVNASQPQYSLTYESHKAYFRCLRQGPALWVEIPRDWPGVGWLEAGRTAFLSAQHLTAQAAGKLLSGTSLQQARQQIAGGGLLQSLANRLSQDPNLYFEFRPTDSES